MPSGLFLCFPNFTELDLSLVKPVTEWAHPYWRRIPGSVLIIDLTPSPQPYTAQNKAATSSPP